MLGSVNGTITDETGSVVPGATVTLTDIGTKQVREAVTSGEGFFEFPDLPPHQYSLTISAKGFEEFKYTSLILEVGQHMTVNPILRVGIVSQSVQVNGTPAPVTVTTSSVSQQVDSRRIEDLPLNGRNALDLVALVPGVVNLNYAIGQTGQFGAVQDSFAVAGARQTDMNYSLDGAIHMNAFYNMAQNLPNPDALQEFRVSPRSYDAEFGRGVNEVIAVTRSGTNEFHGSLFEFLRNDKLDSRPFFAPVVSPFKRNQYGGGLGGPVVKNKAFFFVSYQGMNLRGGPGTQLYETMSMAERSGDFSQLTTPLADPASPGTFFQNNQIPASRIQPFAQQFMTKWLPAPNSGSDFFTFSPDYTTNEEQLTAKVDYALSEKDRMSFRYFFDNTPQRGNGVSAFLDSSWLADLPTRYQSWLVREDHIFSPTLINDFVAAYVRNAYGVITTNPFSLAGLGLPVNVANAINTFGLTPDSRLSVAGYFGASPGVPTRDIVPTWQIKDDVTWIKGRHSIKGGVNIYHNRVNQLQNFLTDGTIDFDGFATGNAAADFLLGIFDDYRQITPLITRLRQLIPSGYMQDEYHLTKKVTVNLGVRWDPFLGWVSEDNVLSLYRPGVQSTLFPKMAPGMLYPGDDGLPRSIVGNRLDNFAPRLGVAWDVRGNGKTSVRAGAGIFYLPQTRAIDFNRFPLIQPFALDQSLFGGEAENLWAPAPFNGVDPYPIPSVSNLTGLKQVNYIPGSGFTSFSLPFKTQSSNEWSLGIQQALGIDSVLEVDYVGSSSSHLFTSEEFNPAVYIPGQSTIANTQQRRVDPLIGMINGECGPVSANYNSLQISFRHRYSHGVAVLTSYTWANSLGVATSMAEGTNGQRDPFDHELDYSRDAWDIRHNFVLSFVWELPFGRNASSPFLRNVISGWELNGINSLHSGFPFTVQSGRDNSFSGIGEDTADQIGNPALPGGRSKGQKILEWYNTAAFVSNAIGTFGTTGIDTLTGPGFWNFDFGLIKRFRLTETKQLEFGGLFYNLFNHASFNPPGSCSQYYYCADQVTSPTYGEITSTASAPRVIEFALRFTF